MNLKYILRRFTFAFELRGTFSQLLFLYNELIGLLFKKTPTGVQQITWKGPNGDLKISYYDAITCFRDEVLDKKLYDLSFEKSKELLILDIGANQGFFTIYMKYNYPNSIIYAYEPMHMSHMVLQKNIDDNKFANVFAYNSGVFSKSGYYEMKHCVDGAGLGDTMIACEGNETFDSYGVGMLNIDKDMQELPKFDLIKIDAEGTEYDMIKNMNFWKNTDILIIEFHDDFRSKDDKFNYIKAIEDNDFMCARVVEDGSAKVMYFKKKPL